MANEETLKRTREHMETFRERYRQLQNAIDQAHVFEILDAEPEELTEDIEAPEEPEVDEEQFQQTCRGMDRGQREIFNRITQSIKNQLEGSSHRERLFLTGQAGTGKTFLFKLLKTQVKRCYADKELIKVGALTGVAARLVGGATLHSLLKLPVQRDGEFQSKLLLTSNWLKVMRQQWKDVEFFFIDEISMVSYEVLCMIDSWLRQLKNIDNFFGGINILLFGDLMQLPPVEENKFFNRPKKWSQLLIFGGYFHSLN